MLNLLPKLSCDYIQSSMLEFRIIQIVKNILVLPILLLLGSLPLQAQQPGPHFNPGTWEIDSVTTATSSRTVSSKTTLCVKEQLDFWKVAQAGLECKPPKTHLESANVLRVSVHCEYNGENLHSDIQSDAVETFSDHGDSFTLEGTTTTNTVYQGVQPKQTSVRLQATAHRTGPCQ